MDLAELRRRAVKLGIPQAILEKDYALSVALSALSRSRLREHLVFKGGTALKKIYFPNARFSEDLDFSVLEGAEEDIRAALAQLLENRELSGVRFGALEPEKTRAGLRAALKYSAFLGHPQRIRFDFSFRQNLASKPAEKSVLDTYNLGNSTLLVLPPEELLAEKIHAVFSRTAARDLYDLWFLLKSNVKTDARLLNAKFSYYGEKFDSHALERRLGSFRPKWRQELEPFMAQVPEFEPLAKEALELLGRAAGTEK